MRIIGKSHDYYDIGISHGIDRDLVFIRDRFEDAELVDFKKVKIVTTSSPNIGTPKRNHWQLVDQGAVPEISTQTVFFAGKVYRGLQSWFREKHQVPVYVEHIWTVDRFQAILDQYDLVLRKHWRKDVNIPISEYFGSYSPSDQALDWCIENRISIAIGQLDLSKRYETGWRFNCSGLKEINFAKVLDPYTAFQELSMYVGGVLPRVGNPIVEIEDDSTKLNKHGFDKWTFRKQPNLKG